MLFLGINSFSGKNAIPVTPTDVSNITYVELKNGRYDDFYITKNTNLSLQDMIENEFNFNTILHAPFTSNTNAGNVNWTLDTISHFLIKRKKKNDFTWQTLFVKEIHLLDDLQMSGIDFLNTGNTDYMYAAVPSLYGA